MSEGINYQELEQKQLTTKTLEAIKGDADEAGTITDWESSFMSDIIRRGRRLSDRQAAIVFRIIRNMGNADQINNVQESDEPHIKVLKQIDVDSKDLSGWEQRFMKDMRTRMIRKQGFSEKQRNIIIDMPARMSSNVTRREKAEADRIKRDQERAEKRRLMALVTTEEGFERVAELLKGALASGLKRPAITFALVDEKGEKIEGRFCVFSTDQRTPEMVKITDSRRLADRHTKTYGMIDSNAGTFTYNGLCPDEIVRFVRYVAEDPEAAAVENGMLTGNCVFCAAGLHDRRSTAVGYGPICAKKFSLPWSEETYRQRLALRVARMQAVRSVRDIANGDDDGVIHTVETISCDGCGKYVLHPVDYDREVKNDTDPESWACRNGCSNHGPYFDESEEKVEARFEVKTSEFLAGKYATLTGVTGITQVKARDIGKIEIISKPADQPAKPVKPAKGGKAGRTWDCLCGKQYHSATGRYNHLKKNLPGCGKAN